MISVDASWLNLDPAAGAAAVRGGRRHVEQVVGSLGAGAMADDAALVAAELLANAIQHGSPPLMIAVSADPERVRIAVHDGNPRPPVRPLPSTTNMTGRGLALVEAVAARWGVDRDTDGCGKVVWAELEPSANPCQLEDVLEDPELTWLTDDLPSPEPRFEVSLGDVPTNLLVAAKTHIDNLVREFSLAASHEDKANAVPEHLAHLMRSVVHDFADARDAIKRQAMDAARAGRPRTQLTLASAAVGRGCGGAVSGGAG